MRRKMPLSIEENVFDCLREKYFLLQFTFKVKIVAQVNGDKSIQHGQI